MKRLLGGLNGLWRGVRCMMGEDAYERYLMHWRERHEGEGDPLDRRAFFKQQQERKWSGIKRCC